MAESIAENPKLAPNVDFEDDYEMAQKMSKSSVDSADEGDDIGQVSKENR